jgi:hypothetical protein
LENEEAGSLMDILSAEMARTASLTKGSEWHAERMVRFQMLVLKRKDISGMRSFLKTWK